MIHGINCFDHLGGGSHQALEVKGKMEIDKYFDAIGDVVPYLKGVDWQSFIHLKTSMSFRISLRSSSWMI